MGTVNRLELFSLLNYKLQITNYEGLEGTG